MLVLQFYLVSPPRLAGVHVSPMERGSRAIR
jgi:hypothetical protein